MDWSQSHINLWEFVPILLVLHVWGHQWSHAVITFHCDNRAVVDVLSKTTSRDPGMLSVLQAVLTFSLPCDLMVRAVHFPGKLNVVADYLSRSQASPTWLRTHHLRSTPRDVPLWLLSSIKH